MKIIFIVIHEYAYLQIQPNERISSREEGREYHGCWEEYNVEKRERGNNTIFPLILRLFGRISSGEGDGNFGEENQGL